MRQMKMFGLTALVALVATGLAVAHGGDNRKTAAAAATFTAAPTSETRTTQCTGADGTYNVTRGVYTGTATGDPRLTGAITIKAKTIVNLTSGLGSTKGHVTLRSADGKTLAKGDLIAVNTQRGVLNGFISGKVKGENGGALLANFSAAFNADGTALAGELGGSSATTTDSAIITSGRCSTGDDRKRDDDRKDDRKRK
jgi:hypothetical protein